MWEISNYDQVNTFLLSVILGGLCCVIYDILRALRKVCLNSFWAITIGDILLWIFYAFVTFIFLIARTNGEIRVYVLLGELTGFILFRISISKFLFSALKFIFVKTAVLNHKICELLFVIYTKIECLAMQAGKFALKILKRVKKLLKNARKLLYTNKNIASVENVLDETKTET